MPPSCAQRRVGILRAGHDVARALEDRLAQQVAARRAFLEAQTRERREVVGGQRRDDDDDQRGHARDLARLDTSVIAT